MRVLGGVASVLVLLVGLAVCEDHLPVTDPQVVKSESLLVQVAGQLTPLLLNGNTILPSGESIRESLGLKHQQVTALLDIITEFKTKNTSYYDAVRPLRREALFQSIESDNVAEGLLQRIQDLEHEHATMVLAKIQALRTLLGEDRYAALETRLIAPPKK